MIERKGNIPFSVLKLSLLDRRFKNTPRGAEEERWARTRSSVDGCYSMAVSSLNFDAHFFGEKNAFPCSCGLGCWNCTFISEQGPCIVLHDSVQWWLPVSWPPVQLLVPLLQLHERMNFCRARCCIKADEVLQTCTWQGRICLAVN